MNIELTRVELVRLAAIGDGFLAWTERATARYFAPGIALLPAALIAVVGGWLLLSGYFSDRAESEPAQLATTVAAEPATLSSTSEREAWFNQAATPVEGNAPAQFRLPPVDGLKIASQSWRRGGLGSKALVSFTLRNSNDYAVRDIEISCAFTRRDGSHLTDRSRVIPETVAMKSRKAFARLHVGFVNVNADRAKCALVTASRA